MKKKLATQTPMKIEQKWNGLYIIAIDDDDDDDDDDDGRRRNGFQWEWPYVWDLKQIVLLL